MARIWFITGCSRGLGKALATLVLDSGDIVIATARSPDQLNQFVEKYGSQFMPLILDVTDETMAFDVVSKAHKKFGRLDVVVNNAGYAETAAIEDISLDSIRAQMDANFYGPVYITKAVLPIMRQQGSGHILQVSSLGGRVGSPGLCGYQSAKWAIGGFSVILAKEVKPLGIKVTVLEPGGIRTDWGKASMVKGPISEPYQETVGRFSAFRESLISEQTLPETIAKGIWHISNVEDPPVRLLLGTDTIPYAKQASDELAASDEKWRHITALDVV